MEGVQEDLNEMSEDDAVESFLDIALYILDECFSGVKCYLCLESSPDQMMEYSSLGK